MIIKLENILTQKVISVSPEIHVSSIISIMVENKISSVIITENKKPIGIFTERDVVNLAYLSDEFTTLKIKEVMSKPVFTVDLDSNVFDLYLVIKEKRIRHIVVLDSNKEIAGLVTPTDIINKLGFEFYVEFKSLMQVMSSNVLTIKKGLTVSDAVNLMKSNSVSCVVIEEKLKPVGILTERDITSLLRDGHDLNDLIIEDVMSHPVHSINISEHIYDVSKIFKQKRIRRLVVVDQNSIISGIITRSDIIKGMEKKYVDFLVGLIKEKDIKLNETQQELKKKTIFFDSIISTSKDVAVIGMEMNLQIKYYNPYAEKIFKTKFENVKGMTLTDLFNDNNLDGNCIQEAIAAIQKKKDYDYLFNIEHKGVKRFIKSKMSGVRNDNDELLGIAFIACDTTELFMTNEQMVKLAHAVEQSPDCIVITNEENIIEYVNPAFVEITGYTREEAIGNSPKFLQSGKHGKQFYEKLWKTILAGVAFNGVFIDKKKNGELFYEDKTITPITISAEGQNHTHFLSTGKDITNQKKMEDEILKSKRLESLGVLAGGIAHDFNNILTVILGNTGFSKLLLKPGDKIYKTLLDVEAATLQAKGLTEQLLTFSTGGLPVKETASINELLKGTVEFALRGSNIVGEFSFENDIYNVEIDKGQIHQVINNLVINAMHAMPEGGIFNVTCENVDNVCDTPGIEHLEKGKYIKISFKDHGTGITKMDLKDIFEPYFTTKKHGTGLGLASSFSIIKNHGGIIVAESKLKKGTSFHVYIPASLNEVVDVKEDGEIHQCTGKVLLMDDDKSIRELAGNILVYMGFEVETVQDGKEALKVYKKAMDSDSMFDAVIMDLTIPGGMGAKEAVIKLRAIDPECKVIICSGYGNHPIVKDYRKYGFNSSLTKPFKVEDLKAVLNNLILHK